MNNDSDPNNSGKNIFRPFFSFLENVLNNIKPAYMKLFIVVFVIVIVALAVILPVSIEPLLKFILFVIVVFLALVIIFLTFGLQYYETSHKYAMEEKEELKKNLREVVADMQDEERRKRKK